MKPTPMTLFNMTQHNLLPEQLADGVQEFPEEVRPRMRELMNFDERPTRQEVAARAEQLAALAQSCGADGVMTGGVPFLMPPLRAALESRGIRAFFSFSPRCCVEHVLPDGSVEKRVAFRYKGLVEV